MQATHSDSPQARLVVMGVSGCGKSEVGRKLAAHLGYGYAEGDDYHPPENIAKMAAGTPLEDSDRQGWLLLLQDLLRKAAKEKRGLVLSCSALKQRYRDVLRAGDPDLAFVHLQGERDLIAQRMAARSEHFMPLSLLDSQFQALEPLGKEESGIVVDIRREPEEMVDDVVQWLHSRRQS